MDDDKKAPLFGSFKGLLTPDDAPPTTIGPNTIPGLGLGTTEQARRWAWIGFITELGESLKTARGRPRKPEYATKDCRRAFLVWRAHHEIKEKLGFEIGEIQKLIELVREAEIKHNTPKKHQLFYGVSDYRSSVSRGRKKLEIDESWHSLICEKIDGI